MVIGIDCGGTGSTAVAYDGKKVLGTATSGVGNLKRIGYVEAVYLISSLCAELRKKISDPITAVGVGVAGAGKQGERDQLCSLLKEALKVPVRVETDAAIALYGAFDGGAGMLLIAGTGSIAYGRNKSSGESLRVGGRGWIVGDEGSGCWLGREAIRCCFLADDGRGEPTALSARICEHLGIETIVDCIPMIYSSEWTPARFSELAPLVFDCYETDIVAKKLVRLAASHLAQHLVVLQQQLGGKKQVKQAAFSGGLLTNPTPLREELLVELNHIKTIEVVEAQYSPAVGAARMIRE